ncbi:MAG: hypothetical protein GY731_15445, partial [Gammaproteobacteria bacterium]|nr:hypothetical protein [Gammaproteobacteria bacterium]
GSVANEGVIVANLGQVNLAAGRTATLDFDGDGLLHLAVDGEVLENTGGLDSAVDNSGEIRADGGQVLLTAKVARDVFGQVVNNSGIIKAGKVEKKGGKVFLSGIGGPVVNSGEIDVSATTAGEDGGEVSITGESIDQYGTITADAASGDGGSIELISADTTILGGGSVTSARSESDGKGGIVHALGDKVGLFDNAVVEVSGDQGGGEILVGGDFQGKNPEIKNAWRTYIGLEAEIKADAGTGGDGGKVIVWADEITRYYGSTSVQGGVESGDGGFVEISGKVLLDYQGDVELGASAGEGGNLLFDPLTIEFTTAGPDVNIGNIGADNNLAFDEAVGLASVFRVDGNVAGVLNGLSGTITFQATDDITITNDFDLNNATTNTDVSIVLQANDDIIVNGALTADGAGTITMTANNTSFGTASGDGIIDVNQQITSGAGAITLTIDGGSGDIQLGAGITSAGGQIDLNGPVTLTSDATLKSGSGAINVASLGGAFTLSVQDALGASTGNVTVAGDATIAGLTTFGGAADYDVALNGGGTITNDTTFANVGSITLGNDAGDSLTFTGGLDTTSGSGGTSIAGTVATTDAQMDLGATTLTTDATLKSGSGATNVASLGGAFTLSVQDALGASTGNVTVAGDATIAGLTTFGGAADYDV